MMYRTMINRVKNILRGSDIRNIGILGGGVIAAQLISMIAQPVATRLYTPQDFGIAALVVSLQNMFGPMLNGQYQLSIVAVAKEDEANVITALSIYLGLIVATIVSLGIVIFDALNPAVFAEAGSWIYCSIPLIFSVAITNVLYNYNTRYAQYKIIATSSMSSSLATNTIKIGFGFLKTGILGLIISYFIGIYVTLTTQSRFLRRNIRNVLSTDISKLKQALIKHKAQPLYSTPGIFILSYSYSVIPIFIGSMYGVTEVGYYSLAAAMLGLPISLLASSVGNVFFKNASREYNETGGFQKSFKKTLFLLFMLSFLPMVVLLLYAEPLFSFVFGSVWSRCGVFASLLVPWYWANIVVGSLVISLIISGKQLLKVLIQCLFLIEAYAIYYLAGKYSLRIEIFLKLISFAYGATYILLLYVIYKTSKKSIIHNPQVPLKEYTDS